MLYDSKGNHFKIIKIEAMGTVCVNMGNGKCYSKKI